MAHHFSQSLLYICSITRKLFLPIANKQSRPLFKPPDSPPCLPQECLAPRTSVLPPNKPVPRVNDHHLPRPQAGHLRFSFTPCPKYIQYSIPSGSLCLRSALSSPTFTSPWIAMGSTWSLHHPRPPPPDSSLPVYFGWKACCKDSPVSWDRLNFGVKQNGFMSLLLYFLTTGHLT